MNAIVVTGATGNVGRPLVKALVAAGAEVTAVSRRIVPSDAPGAQVIQADLTDAPAFRNAAAIFVLTSGDFVGAGGNLSAFLSQVRGRVVLLSSQGVGSGYHPPILEDAVRASGLKWTLLRPGGFHSNTLQWAQTVRDHRLIEAPYGDMALPTIDPRDIAEAAAAALLDDSHVGATYELTGPTPISPRAQTAAIATAIGEPVTFREQTRAEAKAAMTRYMPEPVAEATLNILGTTDPRLQQVSPDVERVLGRPPRTFAEWAAENATAFK